MERNEKYMKNWMIKLLDEGRETAQSSIPQYFFFFRFSIYH